MGSFSIDDAGFSGVGYKALDPSGSLGGTLLSLDVSVGGVSFAMTDDDTYPLFPVIAFTDGNVTEVGRFASKMVGMLKTFLWPEQRGEFQHRSVGQRRDNKQFSLGTPAYPLPSGAPLVLTTFAIFIGLRRMNRSAQKQRLAVPNKAVAASRCVHAERCAFAWTYASFEV